MARPKGQPKLGGRRKGTPNKLNAAVKDMVLQALNDSGGVSYLVEQAQENPKAFLALVGRLVPIDMNANVSVGEPIVFERRDATLRAGD